ncbi:MAG: flagellar hook-associated protein FlgK [Planctomycetota bacterium]
MALLGASFQIGRSALAAYQSAISLTGQNIANVGNADYTRLTGRLSALEGGRSSTGVAAGGGVNLNALERHLDEAVENHLRQSLGARAASESTYQTLSQIESLYNELTEFDLSTGLMEFFNTFVELQEQPGEMTSRNLVLATMEATIQSLQRQRGTLLRQAGDLNDAVVQGAARANELAAEIANLNALIVVQEARGSGYSSPLCDRRDALLRELAELMDIEVRIQSNSTANVYINSEPLVEFNRSRGLTVESELEGGLERATVRFADNNGTVIIRDGQLAAQISARDDHLVGQVTELDRLARGLIYEVNRVHSTGSGLVGYESLTGTYAVGDSTQALNGSAAALTYPVENGSFIVHVRDQASGQAITRLIEVDLDGIGTDTSLESLAQDLAAVPGLTASVTADGRLQLSASDGSEFWFSEDSAGALAALGVATLLDGTDAATISLNDVVRNDPRLLAASLNGAPGDGSNAGRLARLSEAASTLLDNQSALDFQANMVNRIAVVAAGARTAYQAADTVYAGLVAQRESVSGVSLDEEVINLTKYELAYQGATRFLGVLNNISNEVLALVR